MDSAASELRRVSECLFEREGLVVRVDRLEGRVREDLLPLAAELGRAARIRDREIEALERILHAHVAALGHGETPVVIDQDVAAAILSLLADERRHSERRRTALRLLGWGMAPITDLLFRVLQIVLLSYVAARLGGLLPQ